MKNKEVRMLNQQFRAVDNEENKMIIEGYAIVFNQPATYDYTEIISEKSLDNTDMSDVVLRYNHNDSFIVLARTRNKSLELIPDKNGLKIRATLQDDITDHVNIYNAIRSQLIDKQSFAFTVRAFEYDYETDTRTITDIDKLYDVSVVDQPFYEGTDVSISRDIKAEDFIEERKQIRQKIETLKNAKEKVLKKLG
ncbi:MAG: HK97 family phage prohead protease [Tenericutes bacterium]|jgi:HK97 family phage prohead protease|nr:HK97 family phage prohead protease [Mycoplasmatota bacterium]